MHGRFLCEKIDFWHPDTSVYDQIPIMQHIPEQKKSVLNLLHVLYLKASHEFFPSVQKVSKQD